MESIRQQALLIYDLFTFNFDIEERNLTGEILLEREGLGANLPPELFPRILYWLKHSDNRRQIDEHFHRHHSEYSDMEELNIFNKLNMANPLFALRNCALVSRYWANLCRAYLFKAVTLHFKTLEQARLFRQYTTQGSPNLVPLCKLIGGLSVTQDYSGLQRSFLDLVYTCHLRGKLKELHITGPLPHDFSLVKSDSPHWGIVNTVSLPPTVTSYSTVHLEKLRFPSFSYALRYLGYFRDASHVKLYLIHWDSDGKVSDSEALSLSRPKPVSPRKRAEIFASGGTDGCLISWYASTMYTDSPIYTVVSRHQRWILQFANFVYEYCRRLESEYDNLQSALHLEYSFGHGMSSSSCHYKWIVFAQVHT